MALSYIFHKRTITATWPRTRRAPADADGKHAESFLSGYENIIKVLVHVPFYIIYQNIVCSNKFLHRNCCMHRL